jgi:uncharacterized membrane protein (UPF0127 family)
VRWRSPGPAGIILVGLLLTSCETPQPAAATSVAASMSPVPRTPPASVPDTPALQIVRTSEAGLPVINVAIGDRRYELEVAATNTARMRGLGGRDTLPTGTGMLFVHPDDLHRRYWMKDCVVAMDLAFLDRQGRIVAMHRLTAEPPRTPEESLAEYHARLQRYPSRRPARYAIEVPPGDLEGLGLRIGDTVPLPRASLDELAARELIGGRRR